MHTRTYKTSILSMHASVHPIYLSIYLSIYIYTTLSSEREIEIEREREHIVGSLKLVDRTGNTFKQFPDEELLGERRELLVLGLGLPEAKEGKEENENPPTVNLSYAEVPVSVHNVLTSDAVTLMLPEVATMKQVKAALKQHGKPEFTKLLSNGASLYVLSGTNEEVPLPEEEPLRGRWHLMLGCDRASVEQDSVKTDGSWNDGQPAQGCKVYERYIHMNC